MTVRHINPEGLHHNPAFSQAVVVEAPAKIIYVGGQNGVDAEGKVVSDTGADQARQAFRNLTTILEAEGATLANIVHWNIAVVDGHPWPTASPPSRRSGHAATRPRPSPSTSSPASAPNSSSRSTPSPSPDSSRAWRCQPASCSRARIASSDSWKCRWWPSRSSAS
jgi:enamine deaminase RidA (YjgF/YER057c/UK114 family)